MPLSRRLVGIALAAVALAVAPPAHAQDDAFRELAKRYADLSKNHDDDVNRERRYVLLDMFPFRTEKSCRKLLKDAFDDEKTVDNRVAVVNLLAGDGEPKDLDFLIGATKKERLRSPVIAIGEGLGFTPDEARQELTERALKQLGHAKDDLKLALLEGIGLMAQPTAVEPLQKLAKLTPEERIERSIALGRCGGEAVVADLSQEAADVNADVRLGATLGLAATNCAAGWVEVRRRLEDPDARVVRTAAGALADAGVKEAAADIAAAFEFARRTRTREDLRSALRTLLGKDMGYDAAAWKALAAGTAPTSPVELPRHPEFFGVPVASDSVVALIDTSGSLDWMERLPRERDGVAEWVRALPDETAFDVVDVSRVYEPFQPGLISGAENRTAAAEWIQKRLTRGGVDVKLGLVETLTRYPQVDTILLATDSHPWGSTREEESRETLEIFRRLNRTHRVRVIVALVMPGGRFEPKERTEAEIEERIQYLKELAEENGGTFVNVDK